MEQRPAGDVEQHRCHGHPVPPCRDRESVPARAARHSSDKTVRCGSRQDNPEYGDRVERPLACTRNTITNARPGGGV